MPLPENIIILFYWTALWVVFLFGGDNRTRTCDLMRVKHSGTFVPCRGHDKPRRTLENTGFFYGLPWQAAFLFAFSTSCLFAAPL